MQTLTGLPSCHLFSTSSYWGSLQAFTSCQEILSCHHYILHSLQFYLIWTIVSVSAAAISSQNTAFLFDIIMQNYHAIHSALIQYFNSVIFCVFKTLTLQYSFIPKNGFRNAGDIMNNGTSADVQCDK